MDEDEDRGSAPGVSSSMFGGINAMIMRILKNLHKGIKSVIQTKSIGKRNAVSSIYSYFSDKHADVSLDKHSMHVVQHISFGKFGKVCNSIELTFTKKMFFSWTEKLSKNGEDICVILLDKKYFNLYYNLYREMVLKLANRKDKMNKTTLCMILMFFILNVGDDKGGGPALIGARLKGSSLMVIPADAKCKDRRRADRGLAATQASNKLWTASPLRKDLLNCSAASEASAKTVHPLCMQKVKSATDDVAADSTGQEDVTGDINPSRGSNVQEGPPCRMTNKAIRMKARRKSGKFGQIGERSDKAAIAAITAETAISAKDGFRGDQIEGSDGKAITDDMHMTGLAVTNHDLDCHCCVAVCSSTASIPIIAGPLNAVKKRDRTWNGRRAKPPVALRANVAKGRVRSEPDTDGRGDTVEVILDSGSD